MTMEVITEKTSELFRTKTIDEIQALSTKFNFEIGEKRQELRTTVGERYRDLVSAAETIMDMKSVADSLVRIVGTINTDIQSFSEIKKMRIAPPSTTTTTTNNLHSDNSAYLTVAAQIKLLTDIPEMIWSNLESDDLLSAQLFLFARHIHTNLTCGTSGSNATTFPVIERQWASTAHFRNAILTGAERKLSLEENHDRNDLLAAIVLLKGRYTIDDLFRDFLSLRTQRLKTILAEDQISGKAYVARVLTLIVSTIRATLDCFISQNGVSEVLSNVGRTIEYLSTKMTPVMKFLPAVITDFQPQGAEKLNPLTDSTRELTRWLDDAREIIVTETHRNILVHVTSIEGLASIRSHVHELLSGITRWDEICERVLNRKLNLWDQFFRSAFRIRIESLIESRINGSIYVIESNIESLVQSPSLEHELDLSSYIWSEGSTNSGSGVTGVGISSGYINNSNNVDFSMKTRAFSKTVQNVCQQFDSTLEALAKDAFYYISEQSELEEILSSSNEQPFDLSQDNGVIQEFIRTTGIQKIQELISRISEKYAEEKTGIVFYIARMYQALPELSSLCSNAIVIVSQTHRRNPKSDPIWLELKTKFDVECSKFFRLWQTRVLADLSRNFAFTDSQAEFLKMLPKWETSVISEESDDGKKIESIISLPKHPSVIFMTSVFEFCRSVYAVGLHSLPPSTLQQLSQSACRTIIDVYEKTLRSWNKLSQNVALQFYFDVQFVSQCLDNNDFELTEACSKLLSVIETFIDPFDLDVFSSHLSDHVKRSVLSNQCLFQVLISQSRACILTSLTTSRDQQQQQQQQHLHNALGTAENSKTRFPLLPVPGDGRNSSSSSNTSNMNKSASFSSTPSSVRFRPEPTKPSKTLQSSSGFFGAMSTSWFGTK